jgi:Ca2+-binding EF-hand superfamily protein
MAKARAAMPQNAGGAPGNGEGLSREGLSREAIMKRFDANKNGTLEPAELARARQAMQAGQNNSTNSNEAILKRFDANGDGRIDESEREKAREAFQRMRAAGNGFNNNSVQPDRPARLNTSALLEKFDSNDNGTLDPDERRAATAELRKIRED